VTTYKVIIVVFFYSPILVSHFAKETIPFP